MFGKGRLTHKTAFQNSHVLASAEDILASKKKAIVKGRPFFGFSNAYGQ